MSKEKTRATFTIDRKLWEETHKLLEEKGYPHTTMSDYLSYQVEKLNLQLEHSNVTFLEHLL